MRSTEFLLVYMCTVCRYNLNVNFHLPQDAQQFVMYDVISPTLFNSGGGGGETCATCRENW